MPDANEDFFEEQEAQSRLKSNIVSKYFDAWARIRGKCPQLAYVDLFCGPGAYDDGTDSTPLLVLQKTIGNPGLPGRLQLHFNDKKPEHVAALQQRLDVHPDVALLITPPKVTNVDLVDESALLRLLDGLPTCPTFYFVDPFGYKGLTRALLHRLMSGDGAECLFFFNYRRVNAALTNPVLGHHAELFFGSAEAQRLRQLVDGLDPEVRERLVMDAVQDMVQALGALPPLAFRIYAADCERTSHYLVFATKHFKGYEIMREVMAKECVFLGQEVPLFEYNPAPPPEPDPQMALWEEPKPDYFAPLRGDLLQRFAGRTLTVRQVFEAHSLGQPYLMRHYQAVLREFEEHGFVSIDPSAAQRPRNTLKPEAVITFVAREAQ